MSGNFLEVGVKSEKFCPAPPTLSVGLVGCLKLLGVYNELRDPKDVFYKAVELASSFSDLQKLTFFCCASRLSKTPFPVKTSEEHCGKCLRGAQKLFELFLAR